MKTKSNEVKEKKTSTKPDYFQSHFNEVNEDEEENLDVKDPLSISPPQTTNKSNPVWQPMAETPQSDEEEFTKESGLRNKGVSNIKQVTGSASKPNILKKENNSNKHQPRLPTDTRASKLVAAATTTSKKENGNASLKAEDLFAQRPPSRQETAEREGSSSTTERPASRSNDFDNENSKSPLFEEPKSNKSDRFSPNPTKLSTKYHQSFKDLQMMKNRQKKYITLLQHASNGSFNNWSEPVKMDFAKELETLEEADEELKKEQSLIGLLSSWKKPIPLSSCKNIKKLANFSANVNATTRPASRYNSVSKVFLFVCVNDVKNEIRVKILFKKNDI